MKDPPAPIVRVLAPKRKRKWHAAPASCSPVRRSNYKVFQEGLELWSVFEQNDSVFGESILRDSAPKFTVLEASAIFNLPERQIRKELELGWLPEADPPRVPFEAVVCILAMTAFAVFVRLRPDGRRQLFEGIREWLDRSELDPEPVKDDVVVGKGVHIQVKDIAEDALARVESFEKWKMMRVMEDPDILGGEPVFRDTRLSVRQIGGLPKAERAAIREDYPYLSDDDVRFAGVFSRAYPRKGRPRESAKISPR
jgi:uncharacterized protein (DUF433 family)